jgi:cell division initiation protein
LENDKRDLMPDSQNTPSSSTAAAGSPETGRLMRVAPLDLRQHRFRTAMRGFDRTEVVAFLTEAADDYEHALREIDRLRQESTRQDALLAEHRDREANLRNTLMTAQRLADEVKEAAQNEARLILREAQSRADFLLQKAESRLDEIERDITELRLRRGDVEGSLESSIQALYRALEFIRDRDCSDDNVLMHRPRQTDASAAAPVARPAEAGRAADAGSPRGGSAATGTAMRG